MTDDEEIADAEADTLQLEPDPGENSVEPYEVLVQWKRGEPHEHAETIDAPTDRMALLLAKRNIDMRQEPLSIWVVPRGEVSRTRPEDPTLKFGTDRSYRNISWYAENEVDVAEHERERADVAEQADVTEHTDVTEHGDVVEQEGTDEPLANGGRQEEP